MARTRRVVAAAMVAAFALLPAGDASAKLLCRNDRVIYTDGGTIRYPWFEICR